MKKISLTILFLLFNKFVGLAQPWSLTFSLGTSNYQGDIVDKPYTFNNSRLAVGIGTEYSLSDRLSLKAMLHLASVTADDKDNSKPYLLSRNLNFTTGITEFGITAHYDLLNFNRFNLVPYVFGGIGVYHFNPFTYDSAGTKVFLNPLSTEGQGLTGISPEVKPYSLTQICIPFGGGFKYRVNEMVNISLEIGLRKLFTDYLDDVSNKYVDEAILLTQRGPKAVALAFRGDELKSNPGNYPAGGAVRGGVKSKDWYYFTCVTASFQLSSLSSNFRFNKSSIRCPTMKY
jgi:hypothetical protein